MPSRASRLSAGLLALALVVEVSARAESPGEVDRHGASYADIVAQIAPSVVTVLVESDASMTKGFFGRSYGGVARGGGSGVVMSDRGLVLTNYHVVKNPVRIDVELHDGRTVKGRVVGIDPATDLALVQAEATGLRPARFADSNAAAAGDRVLAIGAPFGLRHSVTAGVVSAVQREHVQHGVAVRYLQTDARIGPGNSGGPLVNMRGEVLGINTAYLGEGTAIGFAIPSNLAREIFKYLSQSQVVTRGYVGIHAQNIDRRLARYFKLDPPRGALIKKVDKGSPASRAGLAAGDIAVGYGGAAVSDAADLLDRIERSRPDEEVAVRVLRRGAALSATVRVKKAEPVNDDATPSATPAVRGDSLLGLKLRALTPVLRQETGYNGAANVVIAGVVPGSPAERAGLHSGLAILEANLQPVKAPRDMLEAIADGKLLLLVEDNEGETAYVLVQND